MAANNYFGFTHGGTQYGTTASGAYNQYPTPASTGTYTAAPRAGYDQQAYHAAAAASQGSYASTGTPAPTYDYGYGRPAQSYDKAYYQQTPGYAGGAAAAATTYDNTAAPGKVAGYQGATGTYAQPRAPMPNAGKVSQYSAPGQQYVSQAGYSQPAAVTSTATKPPTAPPPPTYSNYDAALYNATTMYAAQQGKAPQGVPGAPAAPSAHPYKKPTMGGAPGTNGAKMRFNKPSQAKPQQLHYCEVCKISCAGPQTYREHLEGQKHKKRQAGLKLASIGGSATGTRGTNMHCQLCDVACTGVDAYAAHVRGSKHQKVVKLHQKLGKPIPAQDEALPTVAKAATKIAFVSESKPSMTVEGVVAPLAPPTVTSSAEVPATVVAAPEEVPCVVQHVDIKPVGQEYIEEIRDESGSKVISFNCKLCDCKFNDPNAKEMHMKGRRHRLQYKKKVQPDLVVDLKPSPRRLKLAEAKSLRNRRFTEEGMGGMDDVERRIWEQKRHNEEVYYAGYMNRGFGMFPPSRAAVGMMHDMVRSPFGMPERRAESSDDRHVVAKHAEIYPKEEELQVIQRIVSHTERALKFVSDALTGGVEKKPVVETAVATAGESEPVAEDQKAAATDEAAAAAGKPAAKEDGRDNQMFSFQKEADGKGRVLKGVMRVGLLAKGLLLQGDTLVQLVVLCAEKPTHDLLRRVAAELPVQLANISKEHQYTVTVDSAEGAVIVSDGQITVKVSLTSPLLREQNQHATDNAAAAAATEQATPGVGTADLLPLDPCLAALAALRHAKWFQARATGIQSCVMVMRVFRDLCQRTPTWNAIPQWAMELLIEKVITSAGTRLSAGDCMRRILEAVASGLLINGPGILDPCEKEPTDALGPLTKQQREDITVSGQHFLRCIAFRKIYDVLGMEMLPANKFPARPGAPQRFQRKRRRSGTETGESEGDTGLESTVKQVKTAENNGVTVTTPVLEAASETVPVVATGV